MPNIKEEIIQVKKDLEGFNINNYQTLLTRYAKEMEEIVKTAGGQVSDLGLNSEYWKIRNKYQFVVDKFKV